MFACFVVCVVHGKWSIISISFKITSLTGHTFVIVPLPVSHDKYNIYTNWITKHWWQYLCGFCRIAGSETNYLHLLAWTRDRGDSTNVSNRLMLWLYACGTTSVYNCYKFCQINIITNGGLSVKPFNMQCSTNLQEIYLLQALCAYESYFVLNSSIWKP